MTDTSSILSIITSKDASASIITSCTPPTIVVSKEALVPIAKELLQDPSTYFDQLSCVTGIDNGPQAGTMEVVYHLYSIPFNTSVALKVILQRDHPEVETLSNVWKSADWMERETFDMYGIVFKDHPDLRRILMPADWDGFPLRKDYKEQELYRDIVVKYDTHDQRITGNDQGEPSRFK